ncbi:MAG: slipin family protein [Spirochaetales bacterium]|jgi:regulator of protease activity HflC (stomatin/prohibitin superfamily)|nr:slipin family protein [Spirochaetales bacterium]
MIILPEERGLLYHRDEYKKLLMPGKHLIPPFHYVERYRIDTAFIPQKGLLEILLERDERLAEELEIVEPPDNHIVLVFENGKLTMVHFPGKVDGRMNAAPGGRVCYWRGPQKRSFTLVNLDDTQGAAQFDRAILLHPLLSSCQLVQQYTVEAWEKGLLFIDNVFSRVLENGTYFFWKGPRPVEVKKADLRQQQMEISGQEIMTRDKVPLRLNFFCWYRIADIMKAVLEIKDFAAQFYVALQVALREYIGTLGFDEVMEKKESIGAAVAELAKKDAGEFGLTLGKAGIKDIVLPGEIRSIMNQVLIAEKKAQANIIMRREETASTRSLLNTAKLMEENGMLAHLKEMEYIERIAEKINQITLSGNGGVIEEFRRLFLPAK